MSLIGYPTSIVVDANGETQIYTLVNTGMTDLVVKLRTSNNTEYMFKPVFAFVKSGASQRIEVIRKKGPPKTDKFIVLYAVMPPGATNPQTSFPTMQNVIGQITVGLYALS
ncbi:MSP domain protein [Ostertagia ostertagi]